MQFLQQLVPSQIKYNIKSQYKNVTNKFRFQYRLLTWQERILPDFIIIGAQKCGTSSLFKYLSQHPQLLPSLRKEVHFFDGGLYPNVDNFKKGEAWYRAHFPKKVNIKTYKKAFEASPLYIFNPLSAKRIFNMIPNTKLILVLRNPTERAISHYFHEKRRKTEFLSLYDALQEEEKRLNPIIDKADYKNPIFINYSYKKRGLYKNQLERYLYYFNWQQILIISSEELFGYPYSTLKKIFDFLDIDQSIQIPNLKPRNIGTNKKQVDPKIYKYLNDFFYFHNKELYSYIGKNFDW